MAKQSGLGDNLYIEGYNLSGDIGSLEKISASRAVLDVTGIDKSAHERIHGIKDGEMEFTSFFNPSTDQAFEVLSDLPTTDVVCAYFRGTAIGNAAASCVAKQINYDGTRTDTGGFTFKTSVMGNSYGLEWGRQLTAGQRTDTSATSPATGLDTLASADFGLQAYLHVFSLTGTSCTVTLQDSADNSSFAAIGSGVAFSAAPAPGAQRIATSNTQTVRRYVRAITTGTFTECTFAVVLVKNEHAGVVF